MPNWTPPLTENQQKANAIIPKFTASLSLIGSTFIVFHVLQSKKRRHRVYHRILLGLSLMDMISSFKSFLSTWPIPEGTTFGAVGSTQSCTAAGFFGHASSLASALYNGSLTVYFLLTIKYGRKHFRGIEPFLHAIPLSVGWGTAIAGIPLTLYNTIGWTCWIAPLPLSCQQSHEYGYTTCIRGDNAYIYRYAFFHVWIWATFVGIVIAMIFIYRTVRRYEKASDQYHRHSLQQRSRQSRQVAQQALLYVFAYGITWLFPFVSLGLKLRASRIMFVQTLLSSPLFALLQITWTTQLIANVSYTPILFLQAFFVPLQGFFNVLIYLRPRFIHYRQEHPSLSFWQTRRDMRKDSFWHLHAASAENNDRQRNDEMNEDSDVFEESFLDRSTRIFSNFWQSSRLGDSGQKDNRDGDGDISDCQELGSFTDNCKEETDSVEEEPIEKACVR